jgi:hypothetical protein
MSPVSNAGDEYEVDFEIKAQSPEILINRLYLTKYPTYHIHVGVNKRGSDKDFLFGISLSRPSMNFKMCDKVTLANHGVMYGLFFKYQCP